MSRLGVEHGHLLSKRKTNIIYGFPREGGFVERTVLIRCHAGKLKDPEFHQYVTPHSCGEVCGRERDNNCPHHCNILCHPGPCPPCQAFTTKSCMCGKTKQTAKCAAAMAIRCNTVCEKTRNCGKHSCQSVCHAGSCDPCSEIITQVIECVVVFPSFLF